MQLKFSSWKHNRLDIVRRQKVHMSQVIQPVPYKAHREMLNRQNIWLFAVEILQLYSRFLSLR